MLDALEMKLHEERRRTRVEVLFHAHREILRIFRDMKGRRRSRGR
jgi:hypothetical protein